MESLIVYFGLPEAIAILVFGMVIGAAAATAYYVVPSVVLLPEQNEPEQEEDS